MDQLCEIYTLFTYAYLLLASVHVVYFAVVVAVRSLALSSPDPPAPVFKDTRQVAAVAIRDRNYLGCQCAL